MALATFYHPELTSNDSEVELSAAESAHAIKSRRLGKDSLVQIINGQGVIAQASVLETNKRSCLVKIQSIEERALTYSLTIATAIPKGDRQKNMIEMLTQLGVTKVVPLSCERSVTKYKDTLREKWQRYAIEACKQSQNCWLPTITVQQNIQQLLTELDSVAVFADSEGQDILSLHENLQDNLTADKLTIIVGPEGGFTDQERALLAKTCSPVSLGVNILRTELACVVSAVQAQLYNSK